MLCPEEGIGAGCLNNMNNGYTKLYMSIIKLYNRWGKGHCIFAVLNNLNKINHENIDFNERR